MSLRSVMLSCRIPIAKPIRHAVPGLAVALMILSQPASVRAQTVDWQRLDAEEIRRGEEKGKIREKFTAVEEMMAETYLDLEGQPIERLPETRVTITFADGQVKGADAAALIEPLTKRELDVLYLIAQGLSNREIAGRLFLGPSHVCRAFLLL